MTAPSSTGLTATETPSPGTNPSSALGNRNSRGRFGSARPVKHEDLGSSGGPMPAQVAPTAAADFEASRFEGDNTNTPGRGGDC